MYVSVGVSIFCVDAKWETLGEANQYPKSDKVEKSPPAVS